jgi:hypothetical protein
MTNPEMRLSDAISQPLISAYRAGGLGLTLLVLGALLMSLAATVLTGAGRYVIVAIGLGLIALPCYFFYVQQIRPIAKAQQAVEQNREMIDTVQDAAVAMTELTLQIQALAFKHAEEVARTFETIRPMLRTVGLRRIADHSAVIGSDDLARAIVATTGGTRQVLDDLRTALVASDPKTLKKYLAKLETLKAQMVDLLSAAPLTAPTVE